MRFPSLHIQVEGLEVPDSPGTKEEMGLRDPQGSKGKRWDSMALER